MTKEKLEQANFLLNEINVLKEAVRQLEEISRNNAAAGAFIHVPNDKNLIAELHIAYTTRMVELADEFDNL